MEKKEFWEVVKLETRLYESWEVFTEWLSEIPEQKLGLITRIASS